VCTTTARTGFVLAHPIHGGFHVPPWMELHDADAIGVDEDEEHEADAHEIIFSFASKSTYHSLDETIMID
jgi:hypothetical protein